MRWRDTVRGGRIVTAPVPECRGCAIDGFSDESSHKGHGGRRAGPDPNSERRGLNSESSDVSWAIPPGLRHEPRPSNLLNAPPTTRTHCPVPSGLLRSVGHVAERSFVLGAVSLRPDLQRPQASASGGSDLHLRLIRGRFHPHRYPRREENNAGGRNAQGSSPLTGPKPTRLVSTVVEGGGRTSSPAQGHEPNAFASTPLSSSCFLKLPIPFVFIKKTLIQAISKLKS